MARRRVARLLGLAAVVLACGEIASASAVATFRLTNVDPDGTAPVSSVTVPEIVPICAGWAPARLAASINAHARHPVRNSPLIANPPNKAKPRNGRFIPSLYRPIPEIRVLTHNDNVTA